VPDLFEGFGERLLPTDRCKWCDRPGSYQAGTKCSHAAGVESVQACSVHRRWADINLVTRGRRAVVKCRHLGNAAVVLWADPIADDAEVGTYTVQFAAIGHGQEMYTIPPHKGTCPHFIFDRLVADMLAGARPSPNRVPPPESKIAKPGESLND